MKVVIFGASGRIGSRLVAEMLNRGHEVTAFIYGPNQFAEEKNLKVISGDIHNADDVAEAIAGNDAVLSALGSWGTKTKDILSSGARNIVAGMQKAGIKRVVSLTGADARDLGDKPNLTQRWTHIVFTFTAGKVLRDGEEHIRTYRASDLDWTILRSPVMSDKGKKGHYKLRNVLPAPQATIHREDVTKAMADLVMTRDYVKQSPIIYRK